MPSCNKLKNQLGEAVPMLRRLREEEENFEFEAGMKPCLKKKHTSHSIRAPLFSIKASLAGHVTHMSL